MAKLANCGTNALGRRLTIKGYHDTGPLEGALQRRADATLMAFSNEEEVTTRKCANCPAQETPMTFKGSGIRVACDGSRHSKPMAVSRSAIGCIKRTLFTLK
jgi:hypothetical protein